MRVSSKRKKDFSGYLLVDVDDFGVHKIAYYSNRHLNRIKLFGLFYEEKLNNQKRHINIISITSSRYK